MAKNRIKGITVEIGGDTTGLSKALDGVDKNIRNTQSQLKDVEKLLKLDPTNTELLSQKQKLLSDAVKNTKDRLDTLKTASEEAAKTAGNYDAWKEKYNPIAEKIAETSKTLKDLKKDAENADEQLAKGEISQEKYDGLQREINETEKQLKELKDAAKAVDDEFGKPISPEQYDAIQREIIETEQDLQRLQTEAANSNVALSKISTIGGQMQEVGDKISGAGQKLLPVTGAIAGIGAAVIKTGAEFDSEMSKIKAIAGTVADEDLPAIIEVAEGMELAFAEGADATETAMNIIEAKTRAVGAQSKYSAYEVGEAFEFMAMAGWDQVAMLYGIEGVTNLAASNNMDLGEACDIVTDAMTALGMSAEESAHFADVLAAASSNANTNVSMMGESFQEAASVAGSMKASSEDLSIALGLMANSGIKGSKAGNILKNALVNLVKPTEQQANAMKALGLITTETINVIDHDKVEKAQTKVANKTIDLEKAQISYNDALTKYGTTSSQAQKALLCVEKAENNLIVAQKELTTAQQGTFEIVETGQNAFTDEYGNMKSLGEIMEVLRSNLGAVNVELVDSEGNLREYDDIIAELEQTEGGLTQAEQLKNAAIIFGKQNLSGMLAIINASEEDYNHLTDAIYGCEGTAQSMAETMQDNLSGQLTVLKSQLEELAISFAKLLMPTIRAIVSRIQELVDKFNAMSPAMKETIIKIALVAAAMGPVLIVIGKAISSIGSLMQVIANAPAILSKMKAGFSAVKGVIAGVSAPVAIVAAVVAVLAAAFKHLWDTNEEFRNSIMNIWNGIVSKFQEFSQGITDRLNALGFDFTSVLDVIKEIWDLFSSLHAPIFVADFQIIADTISLVLDGLLYAFDIFIGVFTGDWEKAWTGAKNYFWNIWNYVFSFFRHTLEKLIGICDVCLQFFGTSWDEVWTTVKNFFVGIWESIQAKLYGFFDTFTAVWNGIKAFISNILNGIHTIFSTAWNKVYEYIAPLLDAFRYLFETIFQAIQIVIGRAMNWVSERISSAWNFISGFIGPVLETIKTIFVTAWNAVTEFISNKLNNIKNHVMSIWNGIKAFISSVLNMIKSIFSGIWENIRASTSEKITGIRTIITDGFNKAMDFIRNLAGSARGWGADIISNIADGIKSCIGKVTDAVKNVANRIREFLHFSVPDKGPLTDFESWMPDFMQGLAKGIRSNQKYVERAASGVAEAIRMTIGTDISCSLGGTNTVLLGGQEGGSGIINNYYSTDNSRTINQTNNSPKPLTRLEIYRQTRNAVKE